MPVLREWDLALDADKVLWGQGADPALIRARRPKLARVAEEAVEEGRAYLKPAALFERRAVHGLRHERLLVDGGFLQGPLIAQHLAPAQEVIVAVCTVGEELTAHASALFATDAPRGLALDGVASAAAEMLAEALCSRLEALAASEGLSTSVPLNPGMVGWPLLEGQQQLLSLLDASAIGVQLSEHGLMRPLKSVSLVLGLSRAAFSEGTICDFCALRETCHYRKHYG